MRRGWRSTALVLFTATLLMGGLFGERVLAITDGARHTLHRFTELVSVAHQRYGGEVTYRDLIYASIQGMLRTLDPHTNFLSPEAYARMRERQQASFYGLGILVGTRNGQITVIAPLEGTPASRQGVRAGDVITKIDGEPTDGMGIDDAVAKLKGPKDTQVTITIARLGVETPLELTITRAEIPLTTVRYAFMLAPGTGYFRITDFSQSTGKEVADSIAALREQGMERLLLDLRNNGGGLLDQAIEVVGQFVPKGALIVETRGRLRDSRQKYRADGSGEPIGIPVVVLVNGGTASAAEILAGAIQDHDIGIIVGTSTWGKGLVQTVYSLSYGGALTLTTASYYTPSGRLIQRDYSSYYDYYTHAERASRQEDSDVFYTDLGRKVFGGGGITPDVVVEPESPATFLVFLAARNA